MGLRTHDDTDNGRFLCYIHASRLSGRANIRAHNYNVFSIDAPNDVGQIAVAFPNRPRKSVCYATARTRVYARVLAVIVAPSKGRLTY